MKRMFEIAFLRIKLNFRDRGALIWMFLAPLIFVTVISFGYSSSGNGNATYPISIVNNDNGRYSNALTEKIQGDSSFKIINESYDMAEERVKNGEIAMAIVIPDGFSSSLLNGEMKQLEIIKLNDNETTMALASVINNYMYQIALGEKVSGISYEALLKSGKAGIPQEGSIRNKIEDNMYDSLKEPVMTYKAQKVSHKKSSIDGFSYTSIGIIVMFMMFFVGRSAGSILEEKEAGTWSRLSLMPAKSWSITGGFLLGTLILGWIQAGVIILFGKYVFHMDWGNSPAALILLLTSFLFAITGFGAAMATFVKNRSQLSAVIPIITVPTCMLAGCYWPREIMPSIMIKISDFVPQTWVIKGMTDLISRGSDINAVIIPSIVLLIFAMVFFTAAITTLKLNHE